MTTLILNRTEVITLATNPKWIVPEFVIVNNHKYETRSKEEIGNIVTYNLSDSGVTQ